LSQRHVERKLTAVCLEKEIAMRQPNTLVDGITLPNFLYGTAWKENHTQRLTELALTTGFRGIDTANQRKHYHEAAVGAAVSAAISTGIATRDELFIQTKFTFRDGQDHRLPYDPNTPIATQVEQSFASSLDHLGVTIIDSYLLHGPSRREGLSGSDWEAWHAMEAIHDSGRARFLGVSNVTLEQLVALYEGARIKPHFVQNRCYANRGWDREIRSFCNANGMVYQGFSLLTANREVLTHPTLLRIAEHHVRTAAQIVFRFALDVGMVPLTGTTDPSHMQIDLEVLDFELDQDEVRRIERLLTM